MPKKRLMKELSKAEIAEYQRVSVEVFAYLVSEHTGHSCAVETMLDLTSVFRTMLESYVWLEDNRGTLPAEEWQEKFAAWLDTVRGVIDIHKSIKISRQEHNLAPTGERMN
jgi:hypothetical protein